GVASLIAEQAVDQLDVEYISLSEIGIAHRVDDFLGIVDLEVGIGGDERPDLDEKLVVVGR
ncbi:hypothetical protein, partial [Enterobacter hormaechei]|uniref:hypothetical protein n=1 Tax=Enterobacter hormaechei TaxID=158836 RepID=UPI0013CFEDE0